jgi:hypothetical protein
MIIIFSCIGLVGIAFILAEIAERLSLDIIEKIGFVLFLIGAVVLILVLILWPSIYYSTVGEIEEFKAVEKTVDSFGYGRNNLNIERAATINSVIKWNAWLARSKYWNDSILDIYYPDEIEKLNYIR